MSLVDRLQRFGPEPSRDQPESGAERNSALEEGIGPATRQSDPLFARRERIRTLLHERLGSRLFDASMDQGALHDYVVEELQTVMASAALAVSPLERREILATLTADVLGHGPIQKFLDDPDITEIMVNGTNAIYVESRGQLIKSRVRFQSEAHLRRVIERICAGVGRRIDESSPLVDARLADGSRVNAIIPPLAVRGSALTIRKFPTNPLSIDDLLTARSITQEAASFLEGCVTGRVSIVVSGGTGTGKTTMLNILSGFIPTNERIVTIEDAMELQLDQEHVITLEARPANTEGQGVVSIRDLVRNSLRMRPDRIVIGECRGGEALDMLQAMNTGHEGSLTTAHANSPRDMLSRLETMVLMAGLELPSRAIRDQIASAVDLIVQLTRLKDGRRVVSKITEVVGIDPDSPNATIALRDIFDFDWDAGYSNDAGYAGLLRPTGVRPSFDDRLVAHGVHFPNELFASPEP